MRSGPIRSEPAEERFDRRAEVLPLWERGRDANVELPWSKASRPGALNDVQPLLAKARSAVLVVGTTKISLGLLDAVLGRLAAPCRLYVYGDRALEDDDALVHRLTGMGDRVLVRLGPPPPADWIVTDQGRTGRLVMGPTSRDRRWVVPVEDSLARSLFEAFRTLFWFHVSREALPDTDGEVAFRKPLDAPFKSPGADLPLAAGRLRFGGDLDDQIPDAEIRISPDASDPGRAGVLFVPPAGCVADNGADGPVDLALPLELCRRGHRVIWADTGLPRTAVTHQRMIVDLVEAPIALQLEWPRGVAIDLCHRLDRMAQRPSWEFHPKKRLGDVKGQVLLEGSKRPEEIIPSVPLNAGDVEASLREFDSARPAPFPDIPPLALEAIVRWRRAPAALPAGAREAGIVRDWKAVDEWATRTVAGCRAALDELENQVGKWTNQLRRWLPSEDRNALARERGQLRDEIDGIGESPPSKMADEAKERMERLTRVAVRLNELRRTDHGDRQAAEDAKEKEAQKSAWKQRIRTAENELKEVRSRLAENEEEQGRAREEHQTAQAALDAVVASKRQEREVFLEQERVRLEAELEAARSHRKSREIQSSKPARKEAGHRVRDAEKEVARNKREREDIAAWAPPGAELGDAPTRLSEAEHKISHLRTEAGSLSKEGEKLVRAASEEFRFKKPDRLPVPSANEVGPLPRVPAEAPPELGDLHEHRKERFLVIRTWEQLGPAEPVAARLDARLVVDASAPKA